MQKIILMMVAVMVSSLTFAQKIKVSEVPVAVSNTFNKQYPTAKEVKWEKENGNYEVNFDLKEEDYSVLMNAEGKVLETEVEIKLEQLPVEIFEYVRTHYTGNKIKKAAKITDAGGVITFEAEIKGMDLIFDSKGKFVKEMKD